MIYNKHDRFDKFHCNVFRRFPSCFATFFTAQFKEMFVTHSLRMRTFICLPSASAERALHKYIIIIVYHLEKRSTRQIDNKTFIVYLHTKLFNVISYFGETHDSQPHLRDDKKTAQYNIGAPKHKCVLLFCALL